MGTTRACCNVSLELCLNKVSSVKFSKKKCEILESTMNETGKLLSQFCLVHLCSEFSMIITHCYGYLLLFI